MINRTFFSILVVLILASSCLAAGSISMTVDTSKDSVRYLKISWQADTPGGAVPIDLLTDNFFYNGATITSYIKGYYLYMVEVIPGVPAPSPNYSISIYDAGNVNISETLLINLSPTTAKLVNFGLSANGYYLVGGPLLFHIENTVGSAKATILVTLVGN